MNTATEQILSTIESVVDQKIQELDNIGDDDLEAIRRRRLAELKAEDEERRSWVSNQHGSLTDLNEEPEFFDAVKKSTRVVALFVRPASVPCVALAEHVARLSESHMETRFVKIDAEKSPFLTKRLKIWMLPTLLLVKKQRTIKQHVGLDDFGGIDFPTSALEKVLVDDEIIHANGEEPVAQRVLRQSILRPEDDDDLDWD